MIFSRKQKQKKDLPEWSMKKQKAYKISRILWLSQIIIALLVSIFIVIKAAII